MSASPVQSISDYLDAMVELQERWQKDELWFRGEHSKHKKTRLTPKAYRSGRSLNELLDFEFQIWEAFIRCGPQLAEIIPNDDFEWYFLMQHHGAPTRLLDWSDGSLIALHFAVSGDSTDDGDRFVYVLDPDWLEEQLPECPDDDEGNNKFMEAYLPMPESRRGQEPLKDEPVLMESPHIVRRIAAQRSRFILFGKDRDWLSARSDVKTNHISSIRIDGKSAHEIKRDLRSCGITESVIFPDLDGLGDEMKAFWDDLIS